MAAKAKAATSERQSQPGDAQFKRVIGKMLSTPPKQHDEMKKGGSPKAAPRTSGKGAKG